MTLRIIVDRNSISVAVGDEVLKMPKQEFYEALRECERAVESGLLFACLSIPARGEKLKPGERIARPVRTMAGGGGLKIYIPAREAKWLGISHLTPVKITPATGENGENILILSRAPGGRGGGSPRRTGRWKNGNGRV